MVGRLFREQEIGRFDPCHPDHLELGAWSPWALVERSNVQMKSTQR